PLPPALVVLASVAFRCSLPPRPPPFPYTTLFRSARLPAPARAGLLTLGDAAVDGLDVVCRLLPDPAALVSRAEALQQRPDPPVRSEEHTSELQSHLNFVCRLLLEKKKTRATPT